MRAKRKNAGERLRLAGIAVAALVLVLAPRLARSQSPQVIELLADHDSRFKIAGEKNPVIMVHAGELVTLRVTAKKAQNRNRDGSIHGFALLHAKDRAKVPGWDFLFHPGVQEISAIAPMEPGEYVGVCTVICSDFHDGMNLRFVVLP